MNSEEPGKPGQPQARVSGAPEIEEGLPALCERR